MQIYGPAYLHGAQAISSPHSPRAEAAPAPRPSASNISDELAISDVGQFVGQVSDLPEIRADRVAALRAAIADGAYETDDKLNLALDRLLEEIG